MWQRACESPARIVHAVERIRDVLVRLRFAVGKVRLDHRSLVDDERVFVLVISRNVPLQRGVRGGSGPEEGRSERVSLCASGVEQPVLPAAIRVRHRARRCRDDALP